MHRYRLQFGVFRNEYTDQEGFFHPTFQEPITEEFQLANGQDIIHKIKEILFEYGIIDISKGMTCTLIE